MPGALRRRRGAATLAGEARDVGRHVPAAAGRAARALGAAAALLGQRGAATAAGVFLLVGVQSGPSERHLARRNAIRHSWIRWENVSRTVLVCFLLGRRELRPGALRRLEAEAAENGDVLWLTNATDEGVPTLKGYEWWRTAASLLPADSGGGGIAHFAKVDDDSFVHLINLEADLRRLWVRRRRRRRRSNRPPPARPPRPRLDPAPARPHRRSACLSCTTVRSRSPATTRRSGGCAAGRGSRTDATTGRRRARGRARTRPSPS